MKSSSDIVSPNGAYYNKDTAPEVMKVLDKCIQNKKPVRIYLGNPETGANWNEEHDTIGRVGRSTGPHKVPLLVEEGKNWGGAILTHCILRIVQRRGALELYRHPKFKLPTVEIKEEALCKGYSYALYLNGEIYSNHKNLKSAVKLRDYFTE